MGGRFAHPYKCMVDVKYIQQTQQQKSQQQLQQQHLDKTRAKYFFSVISQPSLSPSPFSHNSKVGAARVISFAKDQPGVFYITGRDTLESEASECFYLLQAMKIKNQENSKRIKSLNISR